MDRQHTLMDFSCLVARVLHHRQYRNFIFWFLVSQSSLVGAFPTLQRVPFVVILRGQPTRNVPLRFGFFSLVRRYSSASTENLLLSSSDENHQLPRTVRANSNLPTMSSATPSRSFPRAAVSAVIRWQAIESSSALLPSASTASVKSSVTSVKYLIIQRGKEPNLGMWSLPGGKIEWGESTLQAAKREIREETNLTPDMIHWHDKPFASSDSIIEVNGNGEQEDSPQAVSFHYVISQCFGAVIATESTASHPPPIQPMDDAMDAQWWDLARVQHEEQQGRVTAEVAQVVELAELLFTKGLFPCLSSEK